MSNKKKLKEIKEMLLNLNKITSEYNTGLINDDEYLKYLKSEINFIKKMKIEEFKNDIKKGLTEIENLKEIRKKLEFNSILSREEKEFILTYL